MDLKKWKKIQEKLINFVVVLFFVNVNRSAVRFFPSLYYCTAHITHSFDYKFNILCIISTLASFSSLTFVFFFLFCIPSLRFWRRFLPSALFFFQSLLLLVVLFFLLVILRFVCVYILVFQSNQNSSQTVILSVASTSFCVCFCNRAPIYLLPRSFR